MTRQTLFGIGICAFLVVIAIGAVIVTQTDQSDIAITTISQNDISEAGSIAAIESAAGEALDGVADMADDMTEVVADIVVDDEVIDVVADAPVTPVTASDASNVNNGSGTAVAGVDYTNAEEVQAHVMKVRTLGNPDATVKIEEFASLTCNHCASFHTGAFQQLKSEYIDTDKITFTYTDFPLNAPALEAAIVARCLPEERYFQFLSFLFETQETWAFNAEYGQTLRQNAKLMGATDNMLDACLHNQGVRAALVARMQQAGQKYNVRSTPSFVVNDGAELLTGAQPFPAFKVMIEKHMTANTAE